MPEGPEPVSGLTPLVEVRGLSIQKPGGGALFEDVDLRIEPGEIVCLLGSSGAGKSTLMTAVHDPERLRAAGFGLEFQAASTGARVGVVPQRGALFDHLDVAGNLALAMRNADPPRRADPAAVRALLTEVDLPGDWSEPGHDVAHVSGGEAQRLAVARTLAGGREVLLLDEP